MRKTVSILVVSLALSLLPLAAMGRAQDSDNAKPAKTKQAKKAKKDADHDRDDKAVAQNNVANKDKDKDQDKDRDRDRRVGRAAKARLTKGPVIESVGPTSAVIAWSTNVNSSTVLRYGTMPGALTHRAEHPWGGTNHRVEIKGLQPNTTYFFDVESEHAQGTGTEAQSGKLSFHTPPKGAKSEHYPKAGPGF